MQIVEKPSIQLIKYSFVGGLVKLLKIALKTLVAGHPLLGKNILDYFVLAGYFQVLKSISSTPYAYSKIQNQLYGE